MRDVYIHKAKNIKLSQRDNQQDGEFYLSCELRIIKF